MVRANRELYAELQLKFKKTLNVFFVKKLTEVRLQQSCTCGTNIKLELNKILKEGQASVFVKVYFSQILSHKNGYRSKYK